MEVIKTRRDIITRTVATLISGPAFRTLAVDPNGQRYSVRDYFTSKTAPQGGTLIGRIDASGEKVTLWGINGSKPRVAVYIVTDADVVYLPEDASHMFSPVVVGSYSDGVIDLSGLNISFAHVRDASHMFDNANIRTIRVRDNPQFLRLTTSEGMFDECPALIGGAGTAYSSAHTDAEYARIDNLH